MSYFIDVIRSHYLENELEKCKRLREKSIKRHEGQDNIFPEGLIEKLRSKWKGFKLKVRQTRIGRLTSGILQNGTFANYIFRSVFGFCGGALVSLLLLLVLVFQVNMSVHKATLLCVMVAPFLTLGLAFSTKVRCATLLVMPQLSSKRGRQALVAFAYILAINGPMANTMYNLEEMAQALACGQEQARTAMGRLATAAKQPLVTAKRAVRKAMQSVKTAVERLRASVGAIERVVSTLIGVIRSAGSWLSSVVNVCNRKLGTPTERCFNVFVNAASDCSAHLGPLFSWLCSVVYIVSVVCFAMEFIGLLCKIIHMAGDAISGAVKRMGSRFTAYVRTALYVDVDFHHSFNVDVNANNQTLKSIASAIGAELKATTGPVTRLYSLVGGVLGLTWVIVFIKALKYHRKFLSADRFDNVYITRRVKEVDFARARRGLESVLPLRPPERRRFCRPMELRLLTSERRQLARSLLFLFMSTFNVVLLLNADYGLFWLLDRLRAQATFVTSISPMQSVQLQVEGQGLVPEMFRNISESLLEDETATDAPPEDLDPAACLPSPRQPDIHKYHQIMLLLAFAWVMALVEPIVLRLRPTILSSYYPERAQQRAVWLCGFILRERGGALRTMARLMGRRTSFGGEAREPLRISSLIERLKDKSALLRLLLGSKPRAACVVCASPEGPDEPLASCEALGCSAKYCAVCFSSQGGVCRVCGQPLQQPEVPGLQLEIDSSDEEVDVVVVTRDDVSPPPSDVTSDEILPDDERLWDVDNSSERSSPVNLFQHPKSYASVPQDEEAPRETTSRPLWRRVRATLAAVVPSHRPAGSHQYQALEQGEESMELETNASSGGAERSQYYRLTQPDPEMERDSDGPAPENG